MYSLIFDTTGAACSILLQKNGQNIKKYEQSMEFGQAEILIPQIKNILDDTNISFKNIQNLFVCTGPGSFTGVRSSISAARVFGIASPNLKIGGVSAFEAYIKTLLPQDISEINAVIIETRRDDFYAQFFDHHLQKVSEPEAISYENLLTKLKKKGVSVSLVGDGVKRFLNIPSGLCLRSIKIFDNLPIEAIADIGHQQLKNKKLNYPKPLYLRAPDVTPPTKI